MSNLTLHSSNRSRRSNSNPRVPVRYSVPVGGLPDIVIIRPTEPLGRKLGIRPMEIQPLNANPFADWTCHLFAAGRTPYFLALNTASLYTVLFPAARISRLATFESRLFGHLQGALVQDGFEFHYKRLIDSQGGPVNYARPLNSATGGTIVDLSDLATYYLEEPGATPDTVSARINQAPLAAIDHTSPKGAFRALSFRH